MQIFDRDRDAIANGPEEGGGGGGDGVVSWIFFDIFLAYHFGHGPSPAPREMLSVHSLEGGTLNPDEGRCRRCREEVGGEDGVV
jgi:hypothetical protein